MSCWGKLDASPSSVSYFISIEDYTDANKVLGAIWWYSIFNAVSGRFSDGSNGAIDTGPITLVSGDTDWHHFVIWRDGATGYLSMDGGEAVTGSIGTGRPNNITATTFRVGTRANADWFLNGLVDEVAIWSRVLTADERTALYAAGAGKYYPN